MTRREILQNLTGAAVVAGAAATLAASPAPGGKIKRGVSLYSYQEEIYTRSMTLEDCLAEASTIGAYGIEMLPEQLIRGFPNPSEESIRHWLSLNEKYGTIPVTYTQFQDTYLTPAHDLTTDEGVQMMEHDLRLAKRMGFKNLRLLIGTPLSVIENSIPIAEKLDMRMNIEIHAPCPIDGPLVAKWVEIIDRHKTTHFGLNPDLGLFVERVPRIDRDRRIRDGRTRAKVSEFIDREHELGTPLAKVAVELNRMSASAGESEYLKAVYSPGFQKPELLRTLVPYSHHIHAKFYEMTEDYHEYSIPYDRIIRVLLDAGYEGYLCSEWEGQRTTQDAFETDSCEQVRRQHVMLKRLLNEA